MLGNKKGNQISHYVKDYVLYDLETTGLSCDHDEVIEISAIKVRNGNVVEEFNTLVNPQMPIPWQASSVNHITDDMVKNAPCFKEVLLSFLSFIGDDVLVGHNIQRFDMKFIYRDCEKYFNKTLTNDYVDTLNLARLVFPNWEHRTLSDLSTHYGISTKGAHRALTDCRMNQKVFERMGQEKVNIKICPDCGKPMTKRKGKYGEFWGCMGYPECKHTEKIYGVRR